MQSFEYLAALVCMPLAAPTCVHGFVILRHAITLWRSLFRKSSQIGTDRFQLDVTACILSGRSVLRMPLAVMASYAVSTVNDDDDEKTSML